jgi:leucyl-tRNA synthetase
VIANLYTLFAAIEKIDNLSQKNAFGVFLQMLFPACPHLASELYTQLFGVEITAVKFPTVDQTAIVNTTHKVTVQINGKVKTVLEFQKEPSEDDVISALQVDKKTTQYFETGMPKYIFIKGKVLNIIYGNSN